MDVANEILQRRNDSHSPKYLTLNVEFSMPNTIEASSGVFNVKLAKTTAGLGVTITGKQPLRSSINHVKASIKFNCVHECHLAFIFVPVFSSQF